MAEDAEDELKLPTITPVRKPFSLIPVSLKEAALDSPPFRATVVHFADQVDAVEKWLDGYVRAAGKLAQEVSVLEGLVSALYTSFNPPVTLSEAVIDHDYTLLALQRYGECARDHYAHTISGLKKTQSVVIEPIKTFLNNDVRNFKETRKQLDQMQKHYDGLLARYYSQFKGKEASALREDAFQLHEARKAYLKSSMDYCIQAPQLHATLDDLLIRVFCDQWAELKGFREAPTSVFKLHGQEIDRIKSWSREMLQSDKVLRRELLMTRVQIEDRAEAAARPSRELDDYAATSVPYLGTGSATPKPSLELTASKQGWLFVRTYVGKPARTSWIRRWFFVKQGIFGWMVLGARSGGVEESDRIGVLLCNVRPASQEERRFCFEMKTKDTALMLQAETQGDLADWIAVFDAAKRKALDYPSTTELVAAGSMPPADPAFAVSPASAPELAAREGIGASLTAPDADANSMSRHSIDTIAHEHAHRLFHKLDLHRKTTAGAQLSTGSASSSSPTASSFGIASLLNASHAAFMGTSKTDLPQTSSQFLHIDASSLAPPTLVPPPAQTNLSKTTVLIGAERGLDLGPTDAGGGVPSSIMANQWGTVNYGHLSRVGRGEVRQNRTASQSVHVNRQDTETRLAEEASTHEAEEPQAPTAQAIAHRKALSDESGLVQRRAASASISSTLEYPVFYPASLKAHDAQMRMLFPNVPSEDRVVLVFRASWTPDERQDLPGRVFVTMNDLFFYSHHYGFALVSGVSLLRITDVSIVRENGFDLLHLSIEGRDERDEPSVLTAKTYLEPIKTLQRRLKFLVSNCTIEEPVNLEEALRILINLDTSSDAEDESDEDIRRSNSTLSRRRAANAVGYGFRVDRSLGGDAHALDHGDTLRFRLPTHPVVYTPKDMSDVAAQGSFDVSAKAMYHILFGDRSAIPQMLYRNRRATSVTQYPWTQTDDGRWTRKFECEVASEDDGEMTMIDSQTVDIANDHLCYVVIDLKTPWHLPNARDFSLVSKIVITHIAKSKCLLRIFTAVDWRKTPAFSRNLIEKHAIEHLKSDAEELVQLVTDQVHKLGPNCFTRKAIEIFGHLGHETEVSKITLADTNLPVRSSRLVVRRKTLLGIVLETIISLLSSAASTVVMSLIGAVRAVGGMLSAHLVIALLLAASLTINLWSSSEVASTWWHEKSAIDLIGRLGVGSNVAMSRSVHLGDLDDLLGASTDLGLDASNKCATAFQLALASSDPDAATDAPAGLARRLARTRHRMGVYRHDLLVSLRMVNTIEREAVAAQYEEWVLGEAHRCRRLGGLLERNATTPVSNADAAAIRAWHGEYCGACVAARNAIVERDASFAR